MSIGRICTRVVATASPNETVRVVADRMAEQVRSLDDILELLVEGAASVGAILRNESPRMTSGA